MRDGQIVVARILIQGRRGHSPRAETVWALRHVGKLCGLVQASTQRAPSDRSFTLVGLILDATSGIGAGYGGTFPAMI